MSTVEPAPVVPTEEPAPIQPPTLSTDKDDYHPGEVATILGNLFGSLQNIVLKIFGSDKHGDNYTEEVQSLTANENGAFDTSYTLDDLYRPFYEVVALDTNGNKLAETWFRDASIGTYDQCQNDTGTGYTTGDTGCRWTNGNLGSSNSRYFEHDATVQRLWLDGFATGSPHTITLKYGTTKGGKHAYDYLTKWDHSENWTTLADLCQDIDDCTGASVPIDAFAIPDDPNVVNTIEPIGSPIRDMVIRGGDITGITVPTIVSGTYAGDSETAITVSFTVDPTDGADDMCVTQGGGQNAVTSCGVALFFGAHVSSQEDWGAGNSAVNIPGSPYHVSLDALDGGSAGERDNQMASAAVVQNASIIIIKDAIPNDAQDFSFTTTGTGLSPFSLDDDSDGALSNSQTFSGLGAGTYTVTEAAQAGWSLTGNVTCTDPTTNSTINLGTRTATINLAAGENVTCTFTNTLQQAHLTLVKTVTNDNGGTAAITDWTLTATGPTNISGTSGSAAVTSAAVNAGAYTLGENSGPANYTAGTYSCVKNGGAPVVSNSITLVAGDNATCTINNNDNAAHLIVIKHVVNDNGGTAVASGFSTTISGVTTATPTAAGAESPGVDNVLTTVGAYSVDEGAHVGYDKTLSTDCSGTIALGQTKTCTITNDDIAPSLTLNKITSYSYGGTAPESSWTLTATGPTTISGPGAAGSADVVSGASFGAGTYTLSESAAPTGYTNGTSYSCVKNQGGAVDGNSITLALGDTAVCSITNTDIAPQLTVIKHVINDSGGTAVAGGFTMNVTATQPSDDSFPGVESPGTTITLDAGAYSVAETGPAGYTESDSADCSGTIAVGESKTCTITNDDQQAYLIVDKTVINDNGGNAVADQFLLTVDSGVALDGVAVPVNPGVHTTGETLSPGYTQGAWGGDCNTNASVTVALGETKTCTITNNDIAPKLHLRKVVVNDNGGTATAADFTLTADGTGSNDLSGTSPVDSGAGLLADTWALSESGAPSYTASAWVCVGGKQTGSSIKVDVGGEATCTITNDDIQPKLTLTKTVVNDDGGNASVSNFPLFVNATGVVSGIQNGFNAGSYTASETNLAGYAPGSWGGDCATNGTVTLNVGDVKACTITNDDIAPKLTLIKTVVNDNGGSALPDNFLLTIGGNPATSGTEYTLDANTPYALNETQLSGYTFTSIAGDTKCPVVLGGTVTLDEGDDITCTITNDDQQAYITVTKVIVNDNGGPVTNPDDFDLTLEGAPVSSGVQVPVNPGTYTAGETLLPGYIFEGFSGDCDANGDTTVALGENKTCTLTNNDTPGHFTGGGSIFVQALKTNSKKPDNGRVTHGFTLHCDATRLPNRLEVNWAGVIGSKGKASENNFHLTQLTFAECSDDPAIDPEQPKAEIDTIHGKGIGTFNNVPGATIDFIFNDDGEPGKNDTAWMIIKNVGGTEVLNTLVPLKLEVGNQQAHQDD